MVTLLTECKCDNSVIVYKGERNSYELLVDTCIHHMKYLEMSYIVTFILKLHHASCFRFITLCVLLYVILISLAVHLACIHKKLRVGGGEARGP